MPESSNTRQREVLLAQLASITTLERGSLAEEYRERPAREGGGTIALGPYYKHQCWEAGRNCSRRVASAEVEQLRQDLKNGRRFDEATAQLAEMAIAQGRAQRAALGASPPPRSAAVAAAPESKKNSGKRRTRNATARAKPSSRKSRRGSRSKE
jgi:hypothetical protein